MTDDSQKLSPHRAPARLRYQSHWLIQRLPPVDWFRLLADLGAAGWTNADVAMAINVPKNTLARWKDGSRPNYEDGRALVLLHERVCEIRNSEPLTTA